jgi:RNA polymerase sigma-70 factor (ECF subfamily)
VAEEMSHGGASEEEGLESLMHRYQQSDALATSLLVERLCGRLYHFFVSQVRDREKAEDLLQECWLRIHKARHTYRPGEPLLPWIYAIARRVQVDHYRKSHRIARHELQNEHVSDVAADAPPRAAKSALPEISEVLKTLPPQQRETVLLLKVAGLSLEEVSRATGVSVGAVKQRAHRAYKTLRRLFGGEK